MRSEVATATTTTAMFFVTCWSALFILVPRARARGGRLHDVLCPLFLGAAQIPQTLRSVLVDPRNGTVQPTKEVAPGVSRACEARPGMAARKLSIDSQRRCETRSGQPQQQTHAHANMQEQKMKLRRVPRLPLRCPRSTAGRLLVAASPDSARPPTCAFTTTTASRAPTAMNLQHFVIIK